MDEELSIQEQQVLLTIARQAIGAAVRGERPQPQPREETHLNLRRGCFVTIKRHGRLRGCIGSFQPELPLCREVSRMAAASATRDPRFAPMTERDLDGMSIEISVLSPLRKVERSEEIEVGRHGLYLEKGFHRGVLLPQVATEHGWDRLSFLQQTCLKAGLPADAWQEPGAEIYIFRAQVFGEGER